MQTLITLAQQLQSNAVVGSIACIERMSVDDVLALAMFINEHELEEITS
jgi:hypothetical protein